MGFKVGEPFRVVKFGAADACFESKDPLDKVHDLAETPLEGSHNLFVHKDFPNLGFYDSVLLNSLDHSHASPLCSLPSQSPTIILMCPLIFL